MCGGGHLDGVQWKSITDIRPFLVSIGLVYNLINHIILSFPKAMGVVPESMSPIRKPLKF